MPLLHPLCRLIILLLIGGALPAKALTNADFESAPFSLGWTVLGTPVATPGLAPSSSQGARFTATGQALSQSVTWGADWHLDCYFAIRNTTSRAFSLFILNGAGSVVNVRYEAGSFASFNGTVWVSEPSLGTAAFSNDSNGDGDLNDPGDVKNVYRFRITGHGWGAAGATYDLQVSDPNGTVFTKTVNGITRYQNISASSATATSFKFGTEFGANPGFWLDDVSSPPEAPPPGPVTLPYVETFTAAPVAFSPQGASTWTVTGGAYRNTITATTGTGIASVLTNQLGGDPSSAPGFFLSAKFTIISSASSSNAVGLALMATDAALTGGVTNPYYFAEIRPAGNSLRFQRVGINNTTFLPETTLRTMTLNQALPFTLEVLGTYLSEGSLQMDVTVRQGALSETFYVVDTVPLEIGHFAFRNRTAGGAMTVDCDDFTLRRVSILSISAPPPPFARTGTLVSSQISATSDVGSAVTLSALSLPPWLTYTPGPNGTGTLTGTPGTGDFGAHSITLSASDPDGGALLTTFSISVLEPTGVFISEFLASNDSGLEDEDFDQPDWIELFNSDSTPASIGGWWLSDDPQLPQKWAIPAGIVIPAQGFLVIFASEKNRAADPAHLHTNFKLGDAAGGYLMLSQPPGNIVSIYGDYPAQRKDTSYGTYGSYSSIGHLLEPTPGAPNNAVGYSGFVANPAFSVARGFYSAAQNITITCATHGATIAYTTDGSTPTLTNGTLGASPLLASVSSSRVVRAVAFKPGLAPSRPKTQTYLFLNDAITQSSSGAAPPGWPTGPVNGQMLDYGMDPDITSTVSAQQMKNSLTAIPTLSLVTDLPNLFDPATGIYVNPYGREESYECPVSVELLLPDNTPAFQIDAGLRIRGGASREGTVPKHNFHLYFRSKYGDSKLNYPLFGDAGTDSFDRIDLRTAQVMSWHKDGSTSATYSRDEWVRQTHGDMGQPHTRSSYYHLYINGQYWGIYGTQERADADYAASYFGGKKEDYDMIKTFVIPHRVEAADGDAVAWNQLHAAATAGFASDAAYFAVQGLDPAGLPTNNPKLLDVDNLIDYVLLRFYTGDDDAPVNTGVSGGVPKNFFVIRPRDGSFGFQFLTHDAESCMRTSATDVTGIISTGSTLQYFNPRWLSQQLAANAKYRLRFADRAQKHLFNGGALDTPVGLSRWIALRDQLSAAILAESARWGDAEFPTSPRTVANWNSANDSVETGFLAARRPVLISQLRARSLFPSIDAPGLSQHGGSVAEGFPLGITAPAGTTIHYTLEGTDPMLAGSPAYSAPVPLAGSLLTVKARAKLTATGEWSALTEALFIIGAVPASTGNLAISEIFYNPPGNDEAAEFIELQNISGLRLNLKGVTLADAVGFVFGTTILEPGQKICVIRNEAAFRAAYGPAPIIAGPWTGSLDNMSATISLKAANGQTIESVTYSDFIPWPPAADGDGPTLERINLAAFPSEGYNWRSSVPAGGSPGTSDGPSLAAWLTEKGFSTALADPDHNGIAAAMEYALGMDLSSATVPSIEFALVPESDPPAVDFSYRHRLSTSGTRLVVESSTDLLQWQPVVPDDITASLISRILHNDGTETRILRALAAPGRQSYRLRVSVP